MNRLASRRDDDQAPERATYLGDIQLEDPILKACGLGQYLESRVRGVKAYLLDDRDGAGGAILSLHQGGFYFNLLDQPGLKGMQFLEVGGIQVITTALQYIKDGSSRFGSPLVQLP